MAAFLLMEPHIGMEESDGVSETWKEMKWIHPVVRPHSKGFVDCKDYD